MFIARAVCPDRAKTICTRFGGFCRRRRRSSHTRCNCPGAISTRARRSAWVYGRVVVEPSRDRTVAFQQRVVTVACSSPCRPTGIGVGPGRVPPLDAVHQSLVLVAPRRRLAVLEFVVDGHVQRRDHG